jgi:hypothetical protein
LTASSHHIFFIKRSNLGVDEFVPKITLPKANGFLFPCALYKCADSLERTSVGLASKNGVE